MEPELDSELIWIQSWSQITMDSELDYYGSD